MAFDMLTGSGRAGLFDQPRAPTMKFYEAPMAHNPRRVPG
jgi:hypothetical protein